MAVRTDYRELIRVLQDEHCQRRARNEARKAEEDKLMRKLIQDEEEGWKRVKKAEEDYKAIREEQQRWTKRIELMQ